MPRKKSTKSIKAVKSVQEHPHFEIHGEAVLLTLLGIAIASAIFTVPMSPFYAMGYVENLSFDSLKASLVTEIDAEENVLTKEECVSMCQCDCACDAELDVDAEIISDAEFRARIMRSRYLRKGVP
ncbi:hypothetical protein HOD71_04385, partial [Candidatus Peribacteria bacterium]|nr:hypothetical protein [Candidatus Peribacteria bacterium]